MICDCSNLDGMKCGKCKHDFWDYDTGYSECTKTNDFNDNEFATYEEQGFLDKCPYFEEK